MIEMFEALGIGLAAAVFVIFVLLTAYFQSPRLALVSVGAVPGAIAGIVTMLYVTNTSLNIESFMGSIMCLGVSLSNSVMLVTFMNSHWQQGARSNEAAVSGASERLRPILMTACAMTVGMVPMALALEEGSQMQAPLGRAVIGGLLMSTVATLLVVPSIFAIVIGKSAVRSPSIYPNDPDSSYYDPDTFAAHVEAEVEAALDGEPDVPDVDRVPTRPGIDNRPAQPKAAPRPDSSPQHG
jgi:Cu/Ag efflux pump CusA